MVRTTRAAATKAASGANAKERQQLSSPPSTPVPKKKASAKPKSLKQADVEAEPPVNSANTSKKRTRKPVKQESGDVNDLPHNLGTALFPTPGADDDDSPPKKRAKKASTKEFKAIETSVKLEDIPVVTPSTRTPKKAKYRLTPGTTPFPDYSRPTPEECHEVVRLLEKKHGKVIAPNSIPSPSLNVAGCGEVPSVLDAMIRTRLSANTTNKNSSTAFQGLVARFGILQDGIGKGSVDWDAVRRAPREDVFKAIERGGLAKIKSKDIQDILQMVYEENQERRNALVDPKDNPAGAENETESDKQQEIAKADQNVISLQHLHSLSTADAMDAMTKYPGIGVKTASCVALFCMQRPSFAVDTHVFRLCQYLGWVPKTSKKGQPKVDRDTTFSHCDVRIPDELKYPLHQLLIKHGKECPRCRAITGQSSAGWEDGCPIEHMVKRHGAKKGGVSVVDRKKAKGAAKEEAEDEDFAAVGNGEAAEAEAEAEGSELSEVPDEE